MRDGTRRRRPRPIGVIALLVIGLGMLGIIASLSLDEGDTDPIEIEGAGAVQKLFGGIPQEGRSLGPASAPVTVEVFNDLQCDSCSDYQLRVVEPLVERYVRPGRARLSYFHFSMGQRNIGRGSFGAVAAGEQGRQWQYIQIFFLNQDEAMDEGVTEEFLERVAAAVLELNVEQWQRDLDTTAVEDAVVADAELTAMRRFPAEPAVVVRGPRGELELTDSPSLAEIEQGIREVD